MASSPLVPAEARLPLFPPRASAPRSSPVPTGPSFREVLQSLGRTVHDGERAMGVAVAKARGVGSGATATGATQIGGLPGDELLRLQVQVYRYSEAVDLAARLVDRTTSGVKTVLQGS